MSINPLPNNVSSSGLINGLEAKCLRNLKASMVRVGCEKGSRDSRGIRISKGVHDGTRGQSSTVVFYPHH